jgi:hypothetical protein
MLSVASYLANHGSLLPLCVSVIHVLRTCFLFMLSYTPFLMLFHPLTVCNVVVESKSSQTIKVTESHLHG